MKNYVCSLLNFSQTIYFQAFLYFPDFIPAITQKIFADLPFLFKIRIFLLKVEIGGFPLSYCYDGSCKMMSLLEF